MKVILCILDGCNPKAFKQVVDQKLMGYRFNKSLKDMAKKKWAVLFTIKCE